MSQQSPPLAIHDKTTANKWSYERSHKLFNSYSLIEYNKIYPNTNSWKTLQEESLWQVDFNNLYFLNTLIEKQKIIHLQLVQMDRPEPTAQVDPRVYPEEGETSMNNSTTP